MREMQLTQGQIALVDDSDFEWLSQWKWCVLRTLTSSGKIIWYAQRRNYSNQKCVLMHTALTGFILTDHRDSNGLNNQRYNLRPCSRSQNGGNSALSKANTSGFKGVYYSKNAHKWIAQITVRRQCIYLGSFDRVLDAASAYDAAAVIHFGEFAKLNLPHVS